ncbi:MAG: FtsX-like permease family protein [Elusimicrobiales bacterium]|nr:FtsX-like permease family protein [Elusimicrobiales bacterium]
MNFYLKMAWRNSMRNKRRTFLASLAVGLGLAALIFTDGLTIGMLDGIIGTATGTFMGQAQIHRKGFRDAMDADLFVRNGPALLERLASEPLVKAYAPRTVSFAMIASPSNSGSVMLYGLDPEAERGVSRLDRMIEKGDLLGGGAYRIVIGAKLAETLDVGLGDKVVLTAAAAGGGDLAQGMFRVGGVIRSGSRAMDSNLAFARIGETQKLFGLGDNFHEIAVAFQDVKYAEDPFLPFWKEYGGEDNQAEGWPELVPELAAARGMSAFGILITAVILSGIVALGVTNTLFMSLYERMFEFGVLRAVGTRPLRMALIIIGEAAVLGVISAAAGVLIGALASHLTALRGLDYSGVDYAGVTILEPLRPAFRAFQFWLYPSALFVFTLLVSLYPAVYAARMNPVEAMRKSL